MSLTVSTRINSTRRNSNSIGLHNNKIQKNLYPNIIMIPNVLRPTNLCRINNYKKSEKKSIRHPSISHNPLFNCRLKNKRNKWFLAT